MISVIELWNKSYLYFHRRPLEMNLSEEISITVTEVEEGQESDLFWSTVSGKKSSYLSLRNGKKASFHACVYNFV